MLEYCDTIVGLKMLDYCDGVDIMNQFKNLRLDGKTTPPWSLGWQHNEMASTSQQAFLGAIHPRIKQHPPEMLSPYIFYIFAFDH
jgi:hypothetical protein